MESFITLLVLLLLITAPAVLVCLAIYNRKRQQQTQPKVVEEAQPTAEGETQQTAVEPAGSGGKKRKPGNRGGRPRGSTAGSEKQRPDKPKIRAPKPEIVCWKGERQWVLAVEVPEELLENSSLTVLQNSMSLRRDESEETCWCLEQVCGEVIVRWNEDDSAQEAKVELGLDGYLLFKLSGQRLDRGRLVKFPSTGSYLVIAPKDWKRDKALSAPPPAMPEPVYLAGYQAHFFDLEKRGNEKIAFRLPDGQPLVIESKAPRFELAGRRLKDASETMGPLFGEGPPRIRALDAQAWQEVGTIVIGEEGRGRGRWRTEFRPDAGQTEQDLPSELAAKKSGWYFLRFYDANDDLIESLDFRFIGSLKQIMLPESRSLPLKRGHRPVYVEFLHEPDCSVQPVESPPNIQIDHKHDKTIITIPRDPTCDRSRWEVRLQDSPPVEVVILVERIWWAVGEENNPPSEWKDQPVELSREDLKATSNKALWLRLPGRRWVDEVLVGFEPSKSRPYNVRVTEETVAIPLREYSDCAEVGDKTRRYNLRLWIQRNHRDIEGTVAFLPASPAPPLTQSWVGLGRKKAAIAKTVVVQPGAGEIKVNGRHVDEYFGQAPRKARQFLEGLLDLKEVRAVLSQLEVNVTVEGSSPTTMQQAKAAAHAIARALMSYDHNLTRVLKQAGFGGVKVRDPKAKGGKR